MDIRFLFWGAGVPELGAKEAREDLEHTKGCGNRESAAALCTVLRDQRARAEGRVLKRLQSPRACVRVSIRSALGLKCISRIVKLWPFAQFVQGMPGQRGRRG